MEDKTSCITINCARCGSGNADETEIEQLKKAIQALKDAMGETYQAGHTEGILCPVNTITDYPFVFPVPFKDVPEVLITIYSKTIQAEYGNVMAFVESVTAQGFIIRIANNGTKGIKPGVNWLAVKK